MSIIWLIVAILIILWLGGYAMEIGGNWIHIVLLAAIAVTMIKLVIDKQ